MAFLFLQPRNQTLQDPGLAGGVNFIRSMATIKKSVIKLRRRLIVSSRKVI